MFQTWSINPHLPLEYYHLSLISLLHILTWSYCLTIKGWVSDDILGIAQFSDHLVKDEKIDYYEIDQKDKNGKPIRIKNVGWNKYLGWPSCFMRWFRLQIGKTFRDLGKNSSGHTIYGYVQDARKHHALNIITQWAILLLSYNLLSVLFGTKLAFVATLLYCVHPCLVQTVGWISGVNYLFSMFWALVGFNCVLYIHNPYLIFPIVAICTLFSCFTLLPGCFNFIIFLMMGYYNCALIALLVGTYSMITLGKWSVDFRIKAFKDQDMAKSTIIYFRKLIIIVKTFWYYVRLTFFPKRMGLFHTWGYHFEDPIEHIDNEFWLGLVSLIIYGTLILLCPKPVQFGLVWGFIYLIIFSNIITANQFVSERYIANSLLGICLALAYILQYYPIVTAFIVGVAIMRIWVHLPTFQNEVRFYESNCFNFPESEVAMGNLGVSYLNHGMHFKCTDTWLEASRQNPLYDVPWYNLYTLCKQNGDLQGAHRFLTMCLKAKTVHFKENWKTEMEQLNILISIQGNVQDFSKKLNQAIVEGHYERTGIV